MTDHTHDPIDTAIEVLNRIHAADPEVLPVLIAQRVKCNEAVAADPTVQVHWHEGYKCWQVGLLGILNGIYGIQEGGGGYIGAHYDDDGILVEFIRMTPKVIHA